MLAPTIAPPTLLFIVLGAFVLGIATGLTLSKWLLVGACRYAACRDFHRLVHKMVWEHVKRRPYCQIQWLLGDQINDEKQHQH